MNTINLEKRWEIIQQFLDRYQEVEQLKMNWIKKIEKNEIDYLLSRLFEKKDEFLWINFVKKNEKYTKIFDWIHFDKSLFDEIKKKFEDEWIEIVDKKKKRKEDIKWWKDKFIMNMFNQIQMSLNLSKTEFYSFDYKEYSISEYFDILDELPENINVFFYNLSFKEWEMYLRSKFKKEIQYIHDNVNTLITWLKKDWIFDWSKFKKKILFFKYDKESNTLYFCTPFWVKNNMWSFFECFWTELPTKYLKYNYYRINWFKLLLLKTWKDIEYYFTPENIWEFFSNTNKHLKTFYIKIKE